jgi:hypothetical protein
MVRSPMAKANNDAIRCLLIRTMLFSRRAAKLAEDFRDPEGQLDMSGSIRVGPRQPAVVQGDSITIMTDSMP